MIALEGPAIRETERQLFTHLARVYPTLESVRVQCDTRRGVFRVALRSGSRVIEREVSELEIQSAGFAVGAAIASRLRAAAAQLHSVSVWSAVRAAIHNVGVNYLWRAIHPRDFQRIATECTTVMRHVGATKGLDLHGWVIEPLHDYHSTEFRTTREITLVAIDPDGLSHSIATLAGEEDRAKVMLGEGRPQPCSWQESGRACGHKPTALVRRFVPVDHPFEVREPGVVGSVVELTAPSVNIYLCDTHRILEARACHEHADCVAYQDESGIWHATPEIGFACAQRQNPISRSR